MSENTTQQLLVARVDRLISIVEESNARLQSVDARLQSVDARLQSVEESQDTLRTQMDSLDAKVEQRLQDTRPIWESVQSRLADLDKKVDGIGQLRTEMQEIRTETARGFRATGRKITLLVENLVGLTVDIGELQDRVEKLEPHPA